jgi:hypothetical protein
MARPQESMIEMEEKGRVVGGKLLVVREGWRQVIASFHGGLKDSRPNTLGSIAASKREHRQCIVRTHLPCQFLLAQHPQKPYPVLVSSTKEDLCMALHHLRRHCRCVHELYKRHQRFSGHLPHPHFVLRRLSHRATVEHRSEHGRSPSLLNPINNQYRHHMHTDRQAYITDINAWHKCMQASIAL